METFETYISEFISNAESVTYERSSTYAEIRRTNDHFVREAELSRLIAESFPEKTEDIAAYLDSESARVRRSVAYLLLGKMESSDETAKRAVAVLEGYATTAKGDETLMARGFLIAYGNRHGITTKAADDVSLMSSLKKRYIQ